MLQSAECHRKPSCTMRSFVYPSNRGLLRNTDSSSELYWSVPILTTVEPLPVWPMFIDRIIDRICFSSVTLTTDPLNPHQFEPCCRMVVACGSLWQPKIRPPNDVHSVEALVLINDNMSHFDPSALFNRVNPDSVTICDAIRRADAHLFLNIDASSCFLNKLRINIFLIFSKKPHILWRWIESLWYIRCRSSTPILKKLAGSLHQDFR